MKILFSIIKESYSTDVPKPFLAGSENRLPLMDIYIMREKARGKKDIKRETERDNGRNIR